MKSRPSKTLKTRGFTLLELIVAILIVTTALLYLQNAITDSIDGIDNALKQRTARTLARQKLEEYLASGAQGGGQGGFEDPELAEFQYEIRQEEITVGESQTILKVEVIISYLISADPQSSRQNNQQNTGFGGGQFGDGQQGQFTLLTYAPAPEGN